MCWLLSKPFHTWLQTAPVHAEGHTLIKPTEPHHLQKAEMSFGGSQSGHLLHHGYALKSCPWKSKNRTDDREPWWSTHWKSVCICAKDSDTDITLVYKNLMKTVMSHVSLNMVCYNQSTRSTKSNNKTPLWFRSGSQFLTWALKLEPLLRPRLKTLRTAVFFHIHRQQSVLPHVTQIHTEATLSLNIILMLSGGLVSIPTLAWCLSLWATPALPQESKILAMLEVGLPTRYNPAISSG